MYFILYKIFLYIALEYDIMKARFFHNLNCMTESRGFCLLFPKIWSTFFLLTTTTRSFFSFLTTRPKPYPLPFLGVIQSSITNRLGGGKGIEWKGTKRIILEYYSLLLFKSFNGGNGMCIPLFWSLRRNKMDRRKQLGHVWLEGWKSGKIEKFLVFPHVFGLIAEKWRIKI